MSTATCAAFFPERSIPPKVGPILGSPKTVLTVMSWFNPSIKPALEVFYQFDRPFVLDHGKFEKAFGANPTPQKEAIAQTTSWVKKERA